MEQPTNKKTRPCRYSFTENLTVWRCHTHYIKFKHPADKSIFTFERLD